MEGLEPLRAEARSRFEQGYLDGALVHRRLLDQEPRSAEVLNDLETVCFALGRSAESCSYYVKALELDADCEVALSNLRTACRAQGVSWLRVLRESGSDGRAAPKVDITDIMFGDEAFDAALCVHVLDHVSDDRKAEIHRVLKPGGPAADGSGGAAASSQGGSNAAS